MTFVGLLDELKIVRSQIWCSFENGNDSTITKSFFRTIFVEVKPTFLLVIEEVDIELGEPFLQYPFVFAGSKGGSAFNAEAFGINFEGFA